MELTQIHAVRRDTKGKGPARRMRAEGRIPAVAYGGKDAALPIAVSPKDVYAVLTSELGSNALLELLVDGQEKITARIVDHQHHPLTREILHTDFQRTAPDEMIDVKVPLELTGKAEGIVMGGSLRQVFREIPVSCKAAYVPVKITHDITELNIDDLVSAGELTLPDGVELAIPESRTVASIMGARKAPAAEEEAAAPAEGAAVEDAPAEEKKD